MRVRFTVSIDNGTSVLSYVQDCIAVPRTGDFITLPGVACEKCENCFWSICEASGQMLPTIELSGDFGTGGELLALGWSDEESQGTFKSDPLTKGTLSTKATLAFLRLGVRTREQLQSCDLAQYAESRGVGEKLLDEAAAFCQQNFGYYIWGGKKIPASSTHHSPRG